LGNCIMKNKDSLKIRMFGEFSIRNHTHVFPEDAKKSQKVANLLEYLIAHRNAEITKESLIEVLWPGDASDNPAGALRNLVYRARQELEKFFPGENQELISLRDDTYLWNPKISMDADIYEFEDEYEAARQAEGEAEKVVHYQRMIDLYRGEFLPKSMHIDWVVFRNTYYKRIYMQAVIGVCGLLDSEERYDEIVDLCDHVNMIEQMDERIHEIKINAYIKNGEAQKAIEYYYFVIEFFSNKLGLDVSSSMRELYNKIIEMLPNYRVDLHDLEETLREDEETHGTFYCNYDTFKNLYRLNARTYKRSKALRFLVLLTLGDQKSNHAYSQDIKTHMNILKRIIFDLLRKNDIFTQFSASQFSLILETQNKENCEKVITRIQDRFEKKRAADTVDLIWEVRQIN